MKDLYDDFVSKIKNKIDILKKYNYGLMKENIIGLKFYSNSEFCKNLFNNNYETLSKIILYTYNSLNKEEPVSKTYKELQEHVDNLEG